ncbi:hypothetical protein, partial [Klebsiella pneumoniae]|uniref:hypothetical protein n=1 Tax=Klebsiella pneumoniae TaxID=573 RepID=UPI003A7F70FF
MSENTQRKNPCRHNDVQIRTREFALMLGVPEHELGVAASTTNIFRGIPLPAPVSQLNGKTRQFWLYDCLDIDEQIKGTYAENKKAYAV